MFTRLVTASVAILASGYCSAGAPSSLSEVDTQVLAVVLKHFASRSDVRPLNRTGYLAVAPLTRVVGSDETAQRHLESLREIRKLAPEEAVSDFVRRNSEQAFSWSMEQSLAPVRIHTLEELGGILGVFENAQVAHFITLRAPGYTADGMQAFVKFDFIWSIHGADASYVLKRVKGRWEIVASELQFYV